MQSESIPRKISKLLWQKMVRFLIVWLFNKTVPYNQSFIVNMVGPAGLEPATKAL